jgi:hypothetical protein
VRLKTRILVPHPSTAITLCVFRVMCVYSSMTIHVFITQLNIIQGLVCYIRTGLPLLPSAFFVFLGLIIVYFLIFLLCGLIINLTLNSQPHPKSPLKTFRHFSVLTRLTIQSLSQAFCPSRMVSLRALTPASTLGTLCSCE